MATIGDHTNHPIATAESSQKPCALLELPPELRNNIYELCFESIGDGKRTSFIAPTPPEFAILQTCRQIHDEAIQIYQVADREYWSNTHFWIEAETYEQVKAGAESMRSEKVRLVNEITIVIPSEISPGNKHCLTRDPTPELVIWAELPYGSGCGPVLVEEPEERSPWAESKCFDKQKLLAVLSALKRYWAIAK
ncbi:hypothetical protein KC336_g20320 [Hortaea werneckii]|nr:hypothetical protein KC336_g20320 [Hortaea werneckii]